jgi:hypothetical protein
MGKDVCSGPLGDVGVGEEILSNVRIPRVSRTWGLLPLIPSGPELLRVAPPRIVVRHCRLGMGVASTQIPGRNTDTGRSRDKGCLAARMPDVHFLYTFQGGPSPTRNCYLRERRKVRDSGGRGSVATLVAGEVRAPERSPRNDLPTRSPSQRLKTFPVKAVIATPRIPSSARNFAKRNKKTRVPTARIPPGDKENCP